MVHLHEKITKKFIYKRKPDMRTIGHFAILMAFACNLPHAKAEEASVTITAPANGSTVTTSDKIDVEYHVTPSSKGDHVHLYVDNKEIAVLRKKQGIHTIEPVSAGKHAICIKIVNKAHTPIGIQACTNISVQ